MSSWGSISWASGPWAGEARVARVSDLDEFQGIPTLIQGGANDTDAYVGASMSLEQGLGETPDQLTYRCYRKPDKRDELVVSMVWQTFDGSVVRVVSPWFSGHIIAVNEVEEAPSGEHTYEVVAVSRVWDANRKYVRMDLPAQSAGQTLVDFVAGSHLAALGYSASEASTGPTVGPFHIERERPSEVISRVAREAGMNQRIDSAKRLHLFGPDERPSARNFDRSVGGYHSLAWEPRIGQLANVVIVEGADGRTRTRIDQNSINAYGEYELIVPAPSVTDDATLDRIGDEVLANSKGETSNGSISCRDDRLLPGETTTLTDSGKGLSGKLVRLQGLSWQQNESLSWDVDASFTTQRLIPDRQARTDIAVVAGGEPGVILPRLITRAAPAVSVPSIPASPPIPPMIVREPTLEVAAPSGEALVQFHVNQDAARLSVFLDSSVTTTDVGLVLGMIIQARTPITVSKSLVDPGSGEDVEIRNNGTKEVEIISSLAGAPAAWTVNEERKGYEITISGDTAGDAQVVFFLSNLSGVAVLDQILAGNTTLTSDESVNRTWTYRAAIRIQINADGIKDGLIDKQTAGGDNYSDVYDDAAKTNEVIRPSLRRLADNVGMGTGLVIMSNGLRAGTVASPGDLSLDTSGRLRKGIFDGATEKSAAQSVDGVGRSLAVLNAGEDGVQDDMKLGSNFQVKSGGFYDDTGVTLAIDPTTRWRRPLYDGILEKSATQSVDGVDRSLAGLNGNGELVQNALADVERDGVAILIDTSAQDLSNIQALDSVDIGTTSPEPANRVRAGAVRAINGFTSAYAVAGDLEEGTTGVGDGISVWGLGVPGDGLDIGADSGQAGGGGTGEGGGPNP